jgi:hypothetical protein
MSGRFTKAFMTGVLMTFEKLSDSKTKSAFPITGDALFYFITPQYI